MDTLLLDTMAFCYWYPLWHRIRWESFITREIRATRKQRANSVKTTLHLLHGGDYRSLHHGRSREKRFSNWCQVTLCCKYSWRMLNQNANFISIWIFYWQVQKRPESETGNNLLESLCSKVNFIKYKDSPQKVTSTCKHFWWKS